jgi:CHAT domain-containing protein
MAIEHNQQALEILRDIGDRFGEGQALHNLAHAFFKNDQLAESENTLRTAIAVWESIRADLGGNDANKVSILEVQARTYNLLQQVLIVQNQPDAAFVELLATRLSSQLAGQLPIKSPTIQQIQQIAQEQNSTLVEYSIIDLGNLLLIWVIKPNGEIAFRSLDLKPLWQQENTSLSDLVLQARKSFGIEETQGDTTVAASIENSLPIRHISQTLRELHQLLIEPIANLLPTDPNAHVIFIPQGNLFLVPFPALQDATGKFLIEQHTILTSPSIQVLELTRKQRQRVETIHELPLQSQNALVVGNPTMPTIPFKEPPQPLNPLPGAEAEAIAIASLLNTQAIIGDKATKVYIEKLMPKARLIHLATHGLLDDIKQLGVPGAIALAPSDNDNGFLTAGEILEMKLNAELIILSACSSGQGKITGDGVIGLSRSLFAAGIPSVIVSLWSVGDKSTQFLMTEFYQNLQHGMNKAQCLRQAMLTTMQRYRRPKSWAAFTLIGEAI